MTAFDRLRRIAFARLSVQLGMRAATAKPSARLNMKLSVIHTELGLVNS